MWMAETQLPEPPLLSPGVHISRKLEVKAELALELSYSGMGGGKTFCLFQRQSEQTVRDFSSAGSLPSADNGWDRPRQKSEA